MQQHLLSIFLFYFMLPCFLGAQSSWTQTKRQIKQLCLVSNYDDALGLLETNQINVRVDEEALFLQALCLYQLNRLNEAEAILKNIMATNTTPIAEVLLYLGKIYHSSNQFEKAASYYKSYLKVVDEKAPSRKLVLDDIKRCANGLKLQFKQTRAYIENLGPGINTAEEEFGPVPSPNYSNLLYFSSIRNGNNGGARNKFNQTDELYGNYYADIFSCRNVSGKWQFPQRMHYLINSNDHDVIIGFNNSGKKMYYYQGARLNNGRIMVDTFQQSDSRKMSIIPFLGPIDASADYTLPHFYADSVVIFASRTRGGYGGMDLFISTYQYGSWSVPKNMGPQINSPYDEVTPCMLNNGKELFFSSNDPNKSVGGFDIFRAFLNPQTNQWLPGINLGFPINSADDDAYFRVSNDRYSGFFSSSRKDGFGKRDIYIAFFNEELVR